MADCADRSPERSDSSSHARRASESGRIPIWVSFGLQRLTSYTPLRTREMNTPKALYRISIPLWEGTCGTSDLPLSSWTISISLDKPVGACEKGDSEDQKVSLSQKRHRIKNVEMYPACSLFPSLLLGIFRNEV